MTRQLCTASNSPLLTGSSTPIGRRFADCDSPGQPWTSRRTLYRQQRHATTDFNATAVSSVSQEETSAGLQGQSSCSEKECPSVEGDGDRVSARYSGSRAVCSDEDDLSLGRAWMAHKRQRGEWKKVAEVLDRLFFFLFLALLVIPTTTILGIVRLFKPDLSS